MKNSNASFPYRNLFRTERQLVRDLSGVVTHALGNMYWTSGSHGVLPPIVSVPATIQLNETERKVVKSSISRLLIEESVPWTCLLIAVFQSPDQKNLVSCSFTMENVNMVEMGSYFTQVCEKAIHEAIQCNADAAEHINENTLTQYGYFLAPQDGYNFDAMEDSMFDALNHDTFNQYEWKDRIKVTPKEFIDSLVLAKF